MVGRGRARGFEMNLCILHAGPTLCWKEGVSVLLWLADLDSNGCYNAAHRLVGADDGFHRADGLWSRLACAWLSIYVDVHCTLTR